MTDESHTYKIVELAGSSSEGVTEAIRNAVARAKGTLRNLDWVEVTEIRGHIKDGDVDYFQVAMKVGFRLEP
jgi:flavin-binding protein dodecin